MSSGVAFVLPYVKARGTELQALQLARQLRLRGWTVRLFVIQGWGVEPVLDAFRQCGALVEMLGPPVRVGQKAIDWRRWPRLVWRLQRCGASVVISRAGMANRFACLAALAAGLPSVAVLSSAVIVPDGWRPSLWASLRQRLLWGWPTQIVTVSVESLGRLQRAFPHLRSRSRAIPNGVSSPMVSSREAPRVSSQTLEPGCFHLCTVGSLEIVRKGLDVILQAMALLASRGWNDCRLTLVGSGEDQQLLADLGQRLGISPMLRFVGSAPILSFSSRSPISLCFHPGGRGCRMHCWRPCSRALAWWLPIAQPVLLRSLSMGRPVFWSLWLIPRRWLIRLNNCACSQNNAALLLRRGNEW